MRVPAAARPRPSDLADAFYVRSFDEVIGMLRNKLSPTIASHYPSFEEVSVIVEHCHKAGVQDAHLPLHAMLMRHGMAAFVVPQPDCVGRDDLSQTVCRVMSEVGLHKMSELRVDVHRSRDLSWHSRHLRLLFSRHALPELLLCGLAAIGCARVDRRTRASAEEARLLRRAAVV